MLSATTTAETAASRQWDAIVVGAGPAGSVAAHQFAKRGLRTLIVERKSFPRDKVCGGCINGRAVAALEMLGLDGLLAELESVPLDRLQVRCGERRGEIPLPTGVAVSRSAFDAALVRAAVAAGTEFLPQTSAMLVEETTVAPHRSVELVRRNRTISTATASVVLLADGLGSPSLPREHSLQSHVKPHSRIGLGGTVREFPPELDRGTIYMAVGKEGYVGLVQLEDGRLNIAAALNRTRLNHDCPPALAVSSILQTSGFPDIQSKADIDWTGTVPLTRCCRTPAGRRLLLLGDAAGYVEPITGEGIATALTSGNAAANLAAPNLAGWSAWVEWEWCRQHRMLFDNRQRWCRSLARLLWHPWAVRGLLRGLAMAPWMARPLVGRLNESPAMPV